MSKENVERARRAYAAMREAYGVGDIESLIDLIDEFCHPDVVFNTEALNRYPRRGEWHGREGLLKFWLGQMEAFEKVWLEPEDFIDAGDRVLVPLRIGGTARHTGLPVEFSVIHAVTDRDGKAARIDVYERLEEAIKAAGLRESAMSQEKAELSEAADAFKAAFLQANEAFNRHDFRSGFAGLPADLEWHLPAEWQGLVDEPRPLRGPDAIRKAFEDLLVDFPDWHYEAREFIEAPGFILVRAVVTATGRASGVETRYDFTDVWEFKDGAPIRVRAYGSHDEALEAAGLSE